MPLLDLSFFVGITLFWWHFLLLCKLTLDAVLAYVPGHHCGNFGKDHGVHMTNVSHSALNCVF